MQHQRETKEFQKEGKIRNQEAEGARTQMSMFFHQVILAAVPCSKGPNHSEHSEDGADGRKIQKDD